MYFLRNIPRRKIDEYYLVRRMKIGVGVYQYGITFRLLKNIFNVTITVCLKLDCGIHQGVMKYIEMHNVMYISNIVLR